MSERALQAPVLEVFASVQGEGLFVGEPQVLLRLAGCPLRCSWCDTPGSWAVPTGEKQVRIATRDGARRESAWATPFRIATWIQEVEEGRPRTLSVTGGEPLVWPDFLLELPTFLGERRLHLETAGAHPAALARVIGIVDHVSLDLKLPADLGAPVALEGTADELGPTDTAAWAEVRARTLELVRPEQDCAKLIVAGARRLLEFMPLLDDVADIAPELPVFLQPVTPMHGALAPSRALLEGLVDAALARSLSVRVVPQVHRALRLP